MEDIYVPLGEGAYCWLLPCLSHQTRRGLRFDRNIIVWDLESKKEVMRSPVTAQVRSQASPNKEPRVDFHSTD